MFHDGQIECHFWVRYNIESILLKRTGDINIGHCWMTKLVGFTYHTQDRSKDQKVGKGNCSRHCLFCLFKMDNLFSLKRYWSVWAEPRRKLWPLYSVFTGNPLLIDDLWSLGKPFSITILAQMWASILQIDQVWISRQKCRQGLGGQRSLNTDLKWLYNLKTDLCTGFPISSSSTV